MLLRQWGTSFMHPAHPVLSQMTLSVVLKLGLVLHGHKAPTYGLPAINIGIYYAQCALLVSLYSASWEEAVQVVALKHSWVNLSKLSDEVLRICKDILNMGGKLTYVLLEVEKLGYELESWAGANKRLLNLAYQVEEARYSVLIVTLSNGWE